MKCKNVKREKGKIMNVQNFEINNKTKTFNCKVNQEKSKFKGSMKLYNQYINTIKKGKPKSINKSRLSNAQ